MKTRKGCHKTMEQKHNDVVDAIAKASVGEGLRTGNYATSEMPLEDAWFSVNGKKGGRQHRANSEGTLGEEVHKVILC